MGFLKKFTKQELSWMMYDWANSAHSVIVVTILPIFFDSVAEYTADSVSSMSTWGYATSIAMAIVALSAPFLGVFGDIRGMRKRLFTAFLALGVLSVAGLAFTPGMDFTSSTDAAGRVAAIVLVLYILSTIGFDASCIYYDAFLTDITTEDRMDSVSTMGYGLGYIGGSTIPLLIFLIMNAVGIPMLTCLGVIFAITAVWWLVFSLPLLKNCRQTSGKPYEKGDIGRNIKGVFTTIREIGADKPMLVYIISYFFYIDGVHTIISMATSYGTNLGLDSAGMLLALLLVQVLGLPFCLLYMKLAARFGARRMVGVGICVYMFICIFAFFMDSLWQFWMLAVLCATSQGGIQALSRSMFGKLIPDRDRSGEFFGFFDIFGKFSSILGPTLVGAVSALAASRMLADQGLTAATATAEQVDAINKAAGPYGILSVILIIIAGALLYFFVLPRTLQGDERKI
ncbi:MFS transporter [uncultured Subdoligranulum sp.]|uniref:MFS transporter n=1 Tax=uncultured Subdoligranulum sp. TaxID=512298 RepID=UPI00320A7CF6